MNETKWLTGVDGDAMLDFVADRLSPRQWVLVSAAFARKLWDLLPAGVLREAIDHAERAMHPLTIEERNEWTRKIDAATPAAVAAGELAQREIVKSCDPDAADIERPVLARPNQSAPAFPLFLAASRNARSSIELIGSAIGEAAEAVRLLFSEPGEEMLDLVRNRVDQASDTRTNANRTANNALRLKAKGDEIADQAAGAKNKRLYDSIAAEEVRKVEEGGRSRGEFGDFDAEEKRERAARKLLAGILREVVGNPFKPPRFEPAWRTSTVVNIARGIYEERAFDRMPVLADALLDADCDEEAVLRHCRGTELNVKEQPTHIRGCWVVETILERFAPLPPEEPGKPPRPRRRRHPYEDFDLSGGMDLGEDRLA
ncbi:MAG TPA: hypothetical protein VLM40_22905 [Gemmata sp.]|nr:hypothetical protein [Gemmata sp.]